MKKTLQLSLFCLLLAMPCLAQDVPPWEVFGGYSFDHTDVREYFKSTPIIYTIRHEYVGLHGWDASLTENMNTWFGGTLDISGHYKSLDVAGIPNEERVYSVLYGPRFCFRTPMITPFVHFLMGVARASAKVTPVGPHDAETSFALAAGGGVDMKVGKSTAVRLLKAEYFRTDVLGTKQNSFRAAAGMIFYFGK